MEVSPGRLQIRPWVGSHKFHTFVILSVICLPMFQCGRQSSPLGFQSSPPASPGVVAPPYPELLWLPCLTLPCGSQVLGTESPFRVLPSSYRSPSAPPTLLHSPVCSPSSPVATSAAGRGPSMEGQVPLSAGHPTQGTWGIGTPGPEASSPRPLSPFGLCRVTRGLFPTCEACFLSPRSFVPVVPCPPPGP